MVRIGIIPGIRHRYDSIPILGIGYWYGARTHAYQYRYRYIGIGQTLVLVSTLNCAWNWSKSLWWYVGMVGGGRGCVETYFSYQP